MMRVNKAEEPDRDEEETQWPDPQDDPDEEPTEPWAKDDDGAEKKSDTE